MRTQLWCKILLTLAWVTAGALTINPSEMVLASAQNDVQSISVTGQTAPRLQNLGDHQFPVTTGSARARLFINQGMMLAYGFNHAEAARSFREAARLDPGCAMAYWGMALVIGPNINMGMPPEAEPQANELIGKALTLKKNATAGKRATSTPWPNAIPPLRTPTAALSTGPTPTPCAICTTATRMTSTPPCCTPSRS